MGARTSRLAVRPETLPPETLPPETVRPETPAGRARSVDGAPDPAEAWLADVPAEAVLGRAGSENFPVAARFLPQAVRRHLMALYGYARLVDNVGDESPGTRDVALDLLEADLSRVWDGGEPRLPLLQALVPTVRACGLPRQPFLDLLAANRMDQTATRYVSFTDLLGYCKLSADPVGRLVLGVFGAATPQRLLLSDRVCTALQLFEHWQDVGEDHAGGRVYLPQEDLRRFGVAEGDLAMPTAGPNLRRLLAFEVGRARDLLDEGTPLVATLSGRARLAIAAFVGGGRAAQHAITRAGFDVLAQPTSSPRARIILDALGVLLRPRSAR